MRKIFLLIPFAMLLTSCAFVDTPIQGMLYTETKASSKIVTPDLADKKEGRACAKAIFGVAFGDASLEAAAKDGKLNKVTYVDQEVMSVLGIYARHCIVAYGY